MMIQRHVHYLIWSDLSQTAVIVIPEEVAVLLPLLRTVAKPVTHLLTYVAPVTRKMVQTFDELRYYTVPSLPVGWKAPLWLRIKLGIFAGRVYHNYDDNAPLCHYLGLKELYHDPPAGQGDTFLPFNSFAEKPLQFMQEWLAIRRRGQDISHTPMGYICQGKVLLANHPVFAGGKERQEGTEASSWWPDVARTPSNEDDEEEFDVDEDGFDELDVGGEDEEGTYEEDGDDEEEEEDGGDVSSWLSS